jgi:hypothetical protein
LIHIIKIRCGEFVYSAKTMYKLSIIIPFSRGFVKKNRGSFCCRGTWTVLLLAERHAVGTLLRGGIALMGTHQDPLQGAVVLAVAVVSAGLHGAFNALVGMAVHMHFLLPSVWQ